MIKEGCLFAARSELGMICLKFSGKRHFKPCPYDGDPNKCDLLGPVET